MYRSNRSFNITLPRAFERFNLPGGGEFDPHACTEVVSGLGEEVLPYMGYKVEWLISLGWEHLNSYFGSSGGI